LPFTVKASDWAGSWPAKRASLSTSTTFRFHHSPVHIHQRQENVRFFFLSTPTRYARTPGWHGRPTPSGYLTEHDGDLHVRRREGVGVAGARADDEGAVHGGAEEGGVRVPPQRALLPRHAEPVRVGAAGLDGALRHQARPVGPGGHELEHTMPVNFQGSVLLGQLCLKSCPYCPSALN